MLKKSGAILAIMFLVLLVAVPAYAINYGEPDGNGHPFVGLMVAKDAEGQPLWRCSGTLIAPTVFLTAGHCTESPAVSAEIWFAPEIERGDPVYNYPYGTKKTSVSGKTYTHPQYIPGAFFLYDLGVVVLKKGVKVGTYGQLPEPAVLDGLANKRGQQDTTITAVGYGLQRVRSNPAGPDFTLDDLRREIAVLDLVSVNGTAGVPSGVSILVSGNANTGGTCFGDSGGPLFLNDTNIVAAVTSFGINGNCAGVGGGYRVDMPDDLEWVKSFLK
ncbi:MAG: trypsin-like serine protease [Caldilineaceae bacterium]|nr:trypsin-like serine protease [Caldilineaceae bacterium]MCB0186447.1 trypsin-like serine protease [Caldilineaceae bacterium]